MKAEFFMFAVIAVLLLLRRHRCPTAGDGRRRMSKKGGVQ
jgi:hypothetical protein